MYVMNDPITYLRPRSQFVTIKYLGKIQNIGGLDPYMWAVSLKIEEGKWFFEFVAQQGKLWNSSSNCHQYARFITQKLGLDFPSDIAVIGDVHKDVVDLVMAGIMGTNTTTASTPPSPM